MATATIALPLLGWVLLENWWGGSTSDGPLTCTPIRGTFTHELVQKGTVESASNVEVKCEVEARGFYFTNILEAVPEGTHVEKGDFLIQLDSSPLEELLVKQKIRCNEQKAYLIKAESWLQTCKFNLEEYVEGLLPQDRLELVNALARAREKLRKATKTLENSRAMYRQGFVTRMALEADEFAAQQAKVEFDTAKTKVDVLENYKSKKRLKNLESYLAVAEANVKWRQHVYELTLKELDNIKDQIRKCRITAPSAGQVVHANIHHNGHSHLIEPGQFVWRRRVLVRLPNSDEMQVKVHVPEAKIVQVHEGQKVRIRCEAYPEEELAGRIERVEEFPSETPWWGPQMKCYETTVSIDQDSLDDISIELRPGLTADITIEIDEQIEQMMVPFQAILKHGKRTYCLRHDRKGFHTIPVTTGATNGKFVVIREGLEEGQEIVLGAGNYRKEVDLPDLKQAEKTS